VSEPKGILRGSLECLRRWLPTKVGLSAATRMTCAAGTGAAVGRASRLQRQAGRVIPDRRGNSAATLILTSVPATIWVTRRPLVQLCLWPNPNVRSCNVRTFGDVSFDVQERSSCAICRDGTLQSRVTAGAEISSARKSATDLVGVAS
jgi:hypothetical protein